MLIFAVQSGLKHGSKLVQIGPKLVPEFAQIGPRLAPSWSQIGPTFVPKLVHNCAETWLPPARARSARSERPQTDSPDSKTLSCMLPGFPDSQTLPFMLPGSPDSQTLSCMLLPSTGSQTLTFMLLSSTGSQTLSFMLLSSANPIALPVHATTGFSSEVSEANKRMKIGHFWGFPLSLVQLFCSKPSRLSAKMAHGSYVAWSCAAPLWQTIAKNHLVFAFLDGSLSTAVPTWL